MEQTPNFDPVASHGSNFAMVLRELATTDEAPNFDPVASHGSNFGMVLHELAKDETASPLTTTS